jgi:LmbE family N-acetylglucosaminyl deacetylase
MEINGIARPIDVPIEDFSQSISEYVGKLRADLVITHGSNGEYGHPQHIFTHRATRMALANGAPDTSLLSWCAWYQPAVYERILNQDDSADVVHDVTPWIEAKIAAVLCHQTQHAMFLRNSGAVSVRDMVRRTESFHLWQGSLPADFV